jgi:integrase
MKLPWLYHERVKGRDYYYVRRGKGRRIPIRANPDDPDFTQAYVAALAELNPASDDAGHRYSWRYLATQYFDWHGYKSLAVATRRARRNVIEELLREVGTHDYRRARASDIIELVDRKANAGTPEAAKTRLKAIRALLDYAERREFVPANVARDAKVQAAKSEIKSRVGGHRTWSRNEIDQYFDTWQIGTREHLLMSMLLYTGCRISDAAVLGPVHEHDGWLVWNETKGRDRYGKPATAVPILQPLRQSIDAADTGDLVYLVTDWGKAFSVKGLGQWFVKKTKLAGLDDGLSAHGVRKASATFSAEAGATEHELMAMFGWSSPKQAAHYTRNVNRLTLSAAAAAKLANAR